MKFYKISLETDLSGTSFRRYKKTETEAYIEYNEGTIHGDWAEVSAEEMLVIAPEWFDFGTDDNAETDPVMEKLNSIEAKIQTNEDLQVFYDAIMKEVGL